MNQRASAFLAGRVPPARDGRNGESGPGRRGASRSPSGTARLAGRAAAHRRANDELSGAYPPAQRFHGLPAEHVAEGAGRFVVTWLEGAPVGCGAVRMLSSERAELKRMYVIPSARGRGVWRALLKVLEEAAAALGAGTVALETGDRQVAAIALHESAGYTAIPCFGVYARSPTSICYEKRLLADGEGRHTRQNSPWQGWR